MDSVELQILIAENALDSMNWRLSKLRRKEKAMAEERRELEREIGHMERNVNEARGKWVRRAP